MPLLRRRDRARCSITDRAFWVAPLDSWLGWATRFVIQINDEVISKGTPTPIRESARLRASVGEANESTTITATVPEDLAAWISVSAAKQRVSKSDFVREILDSARGKRLGPDHRR